MVGDWFGDVFGGYVFLWCCLCGVGGCNGLVMGRGLVLGGVFGVGVDDVGSFLVICFLSMVMVLFESRMRLLSFLCICL